jgi:hypothetical protein
MLRSGFLWEGGGETGAHRLESNTPRNKAKMFRKMFEHFCHAKINVQMRTSIFVNIFFNSLTAKSVPAGTKLVLFGKYVLNIYVGIA